MTGTGTGAAPAVAAVDAAARERLRVELSEERDFLLRSLDDLDVEHGTGDLTDDDHRALKDDYTARAAAVLRRLQRLDQPAAEDPGAGGSPDGSSEGPSAGAATPSPGASVGTVRRRGRWPMVLTIVGTVMLAAGSGYLVTRSSGERLPGQQVTAGPEQTPRALLRQAVDLDNAGQLVEAAKLYDAVLEEDPENVVALSRRGWVLGRSGRQAGNVELLQAGFGYLDRATKVDPSYADAHAFKGLVLGALARPGEAGCEFRLWLAIAPIEDEQRPAIEAVLDESVKQAGGILPDCPAPPVPVPAAPGRG